MAETYALSSRVEDGLRIRAARDDMEGELNT